MNGDETWLQTFLYLLYAVFVVAFLVWLWTPAGQWFLFMVR